jgi:hypothetical protein
MEGNMACKQPAQGPNKGDLVALCLAGAFVAFLLLKHIIVPLLRAFFS